MKKIIIALLVVAMVSIFASSAFAGTTKWKLGHFRPTTDDAHANLLEFAKNVKERTSGRVDIQIFPAAQLGSAETCFEKMGIGSLEMTCGWFNTTLDKRLEINIFPGAVGTYKDVRKVYRVGSPFMNILQELCTPLGIRIAGSYAQYLSGLAFIELPKDVLNPNAKQSQKLRVPNQKQFAWTIESLGYSVTPLPTTEIFTALQTRVIDGIATQGAQTIYMSTRDLVKYWVPLDIHYEPWFMFISEQALNKLSKQDQAVVLDECKKLEDKKFKDAEPIMREYEKKLAQHGIKVVKVSPEIKAAFQKRIREYVLPKFKVELGEEFYKKVVKAIEDSKK